MFDVSRTRHGVMSIHSIAKHAQDTVIYSYLAALHAILHEDMEQDMLSQEFMHLANMPQNPGIYSVFFAR